MRLSSTVINITGVKLARDSAWDSARDSTIIAISSKIRHISMLYPHHLDRLTFSKRLREFESKKATILRFMGKILLFDGRESVYLHAHN